MTTGEPQARIPAYSGVHSFTEAFDTLVVQPRRSRGRVPVVLLSAPGDGRAGRRIVAGLRARLTGRDGPLAPHAYVTAATLDPAVAPLELYEHIAYQLGESMTPGSGRLRLPSYRLLRAVVTAPAAGGLMERRPKELRDHCYAQHREVSGLARGLWWLGGRDQANGGTLLELLWNFVAGPLFQRLPRALYARRASRRMLGRARSGIRSWYGEWVRQQHGTPPKDFFRSALDLVGGGPDGDPEQLDRILVHALLADLEVASRPRWYDPWRRRRVSRFVLLVEEAGPAESRVQRFLRELRSAMEDLRCISVVAVAVGVRVIAANAGDRFRDAPEVAHRIVELADEDRSIVGVVGFGQSRRRTYEAMRVFDEAGLPMVGTAGTADELLRQGGHYYQTAPTDSRAGQVMAAFARHAPLADGRTAVRVRLVADPSDAYSASLASAFLTAYGNDGRSATLLHTPTDAPEPTPVPDAPAGTRVATVADLAREVCRAVAAEPRTAMVWAGRGSHFQLFLGELARTPRSCPALGVVAGDDVTNALTEDRKPWDVFPGLTLHYVSHGRAPELAGRTGEAAAFLAAYDATYAQDRGARTGAMRQDAHVALAWDAMRYLAEAADQAWRGTGGRDDRLDRRLLQAVLYQGLGGGGFDGATGWIDAHGAAGGGRVTEQKLIAVERGGTQGSRTVLLCGAVARDDVRTTWGDGQKHPCPS